MQLAKLCCCWMWCINTWPLCCIGSKDSNICLRVFDLSPKSEVLPPYALLVIRSESGDALLHRSIGVVEEDEAGDPWLAVWLTADWFEAQTFLFTLWTLHLIWRWMIWLDCLLFVTCCFSVTGGLIDKPEFLFISSWQEQCVRTTTPSRRSLLYALCFKVVSNPFCVLHWSHSMADQLSPYGLHFVAHVQMCELSSQHW
jgi:hypothetical protein